MIAPWGPETTVEDSSRGNNHSSTHGRRVRTLFASLARVLLLLCLFLIALGCGVAVQGYLFLTRKLPSIERLKNFEFAEPTQVLAQNGVVIGEFYRERRYAIPFKEMPKPLQDAFLAVEDNRFWVHEPLRISMPAILHIAGNYFLGNHLYVKGCDPICIKLSRSLVLTSGVKNGVSSGTELKIILLCYRVQKALTREGILCLYLNQIYLGNSAYGVEAAAQTHFGKSVRDLTIGECAILAGLAKAPSWYLRKKNFQAAIKRRNFVLKVMWEKRYLAQEQYDEARHEKPVFVEKKCPYKKEATDFLEQVRKYIENKFGADQLYKGGLKVCTTFDLSVPKSDQKGIRVHRAYIKKIVDRHGKILEDGPQQVFQN
ncbi:MAG: transglycosylase domain-containing protein [Desulfomonilaceae bacterium]